MSTYEVDLKIRLLAKEFESLRKIVKDMKQVKEQTQKTNKAMEKLQRRVKTLESLRGAFQGINIAGAEMMGVSYGIIRAFKGIGKAVLDPAVQMQQFHNTLLTLYKDEKKAAEMLEWSKKAAAKTPFQISEVVEATTQFKAFGVDAKKWMFVAGDTAAAMGKDFNATSYAIAKTAAVGAAGMDILRESYGITSDMIRKFGWSGMKSDIEGFRSALYKLLTTRYKGGMERYMNTLPGLISNVRDKIYTFSAEAGKPIREMLEKDVAVMLKKINKLAESGELARWARVLSDMLKGAYGWAKKTLMPIMKVIRPLISFAEKHPQVAKWAGGMAALSAVVLGAGGAMLFLTGMVGQAVVGMMQLNTQLKIMRLQRGGIFGLSRAFQGLSLSVFRTKLQVLGLRKTMRATFTQMNTNLVGTLGPLKSVRGLMGRAGILGACLMIGWAIGSWLNKIPIVQKTMEKFYSVTLFKGLREVEKHMKRLEGFTGKAKWTLELARAEKAKRELEEMSWAKRKLLKAAGVDYAEALKKSEARIAKLRRVVAFEKPAETARRVKKLKPPPLPVPPLPPGGGAPAPVGGVAGAAAVGAAGPTIETYYITQRFQRDSVVINTQKLTPEDFVRHMKEVARQEALQ